MVLTSHLPSAITPASSVTDANLSLVSVTPLSSSTSIKFKRAANSASSISTRSSSGIHSTASHRGTMTNTKTSTIYPVPTDNGDLMGSPVKLDSTFPEKVSSSAGVTVVFIVCWSITCLLACLLRWLYRRRRQHKRHDIQKLIPTSFTPRKYQLLVSEVNGTSSLTVPTEWEIATPDAIYDDGQPTVDQFHVNPFIIDTSTVNQTDQSVQTRPIVFFDTVRPPAPLDLNMSGGQDSAFGGQTAQILPRRGRRRPNLVLGANQYQSGGISRLSPRFQLREGQQTLILNSTTASPRQLDFTFQPLSDSPFSDSHRVGQPIIADEQNLILRQQDDINSIETRNSQSITITTTSDSFDPAPEYRSITSSAAQAMRNSSTPAPEYYSLASSTQSMSTTESELDELIEEEEITIEGHARGDGDGGDQRPPLYRLD